jgi:hypothetical protein
MAIWARKPAPRPSLTRARQLPAKPLAPAELDRQSGQPEREQRQPGRDHGAVRASRERSIGGLGRHDRFSLPSQGLEFPAGIIGIGTSDAPRASSICGEWALDE